MKFANGAERREQRSVFKMRRSEDMKIAFARVISGDLYDYLKDVDIAGRVDESGDFVIWGCKDEDQPKFYRGILEYDKKTEIQGFQTIEQVKEYWEEMADMLLYIAKGDYILVDAESNKNVKENM
jgi:hypothetical protein